MIKELLIYRNPDREFKLLTSQKVTDKHRRLFFESNQTLEYDDVIWAKKDLDENNRKNMLVVEHVYEDGSVRVRLADEGFMTKLRTFSPDEVFLLVASFKENKSGESVVHIS